jgi:CRISPR-associated protein Cmr3
MKEVKFEVVEALRFAMAHTGGVEMFSRELVYAIPLPSTVLGALGAAAGIRLSEAVCDGALLDLKTLAEKLKGGGPLDLTASSCNEPLLWGPLIEAGGHYFFCVGSGLISISRLKDYVRASLGQAEKVEFHKRLSLSTRLGIKLAAQKVTEPGYMYKTSFYGYDLGQYPASLIYVADVATESAGGMVRLGGEGRLAKLSLQEPSKGLVQLLLSEGEYAVALTPVLFYSKGEVRPGVTYGLEGVEEVYGVFTGETTKPRAESIGLGFSEVCKRRRPLMQALPPGTTLKLKDRKTRAVGLLSCLGYGSLLKTSI